MSVQDIKNNCLSNKKNIIRYLHFDENEDTFSVVVNHDYYFQI